MTRASGTRSVSVRAASHRKPVLSMAELTTTNLRTPWSASEVRTSPTRFMKVVPLTLMTPGKVPPRR